MSVPAIANDAYAELEKRFARMSAVNRAGAILNWDRSTMMPAGASEDRADQLATLNVVAHEMMVAPDMPDLLARAEEASRDLDSWRSANLREMRHAWIHASALPGALVEARTRASSACEMVWREARKNADFKSLLPSFTEVLKVTIEVGQAKSAALGVPLYDALLDEYEPGGRSVRIDALFAELKSFLPDLLAKVLDQGLGQPHGTGLIGVQLENAGQPRSVQRRQQRRRQAELFFHEEGADNAGQSRNAGGNVNHQRRQIRPAHLAAEFKDVAVDPVPECLHDLDFLLPVRNAIVSMLPGKFAGGSPAAGYFS